MWEDVCRNAPWTNGLTTTLCSVLQSAQMAPLVLIILISLRILITPMVFAKNNVPMANLLVILTMSVYLTADLICGVTKKIIHACTPLTTALLANMLTTRLTCVLTLPIAH